MVLTSIPCPHFLTPFLLLLLYRGLAVLLQEVPVRLRNIWPHRFDHSFVVFLKVLIFGLRFPVTQKLGKLAKGYFVYQSVMLCGLVREHEPSVQLRYKEISHFLVGFRPDVRFFLHSQSRGRCSLGHYCNVMRPSLD